VKQVFVDERIHHFKRGLRVPNLVSKSMFRFLIFSVALNEFSDYWENVLAYYKPFDTTSRAGTAEVYEHEMPGGQYANLKEQANAMGLGHRWREIARTYADVNVLFGDIVKVTPSSKVGGDLTMMLISRGINAADVPKLEPGSISFPEAALGFSTGLA
jgi:pyruvate carboxylase